MSNQDSGEKQIDKTALLHVATAASATIDAELAKLSENGAATREDIDRVLISLVAARGRHITTRFFAIQECVGYFNG